MPTKTKTNTKTNTRKTSRNAGKKNAQSTVEKLLKLKAQSDRLNERMKAMKEELYPLLKESGKLSCEFGDISLKISNSWILPPINVVRAREILGESFLVYFSDKQSFGVQQITKNLVKDGVDELSENLRGLVELKPVESWEIKPR
ncbi:MAG: hypothetical protein H7A25_22310 [Leptospiraceae bacterium]|nr:hypothetical protein [Leptospiraceae bacterium]MCP5502648.1 hypothetical protein [Leptospiraceae bacterium]